MNLVLTDRDNEECQKIAKKDDGTGVRAQVSRATIWGTNHYTTPSIRKCLETLSLLNSLLTGQLTPTIFIYKHPLQLFDNGLGN